MGEVLDQRQLELAEQRHRGAPLEVFLHVALGRGAVGERDRLDPPAEPWRGFEQQSLDAGLLELVGNGQTGEAGADDHHRRVAAERRRGRSDRGRDGRSRGDGGDRNRHPSGATGDAERQRRHQGNEPRGSLRHVGLSFGGRDENRLAVTCVRSRGIAGDGRGGSTPPGIAVQGFAVSTAFDRTAPSRSPDDPRCDQRRRSFEASPVMRQITLPTSSATSTAPPRPARRRRRSR
jgi:hypothetical protein